MRKAVKVIIIAVFGFSLIYLITSVAGKIVKENDLRKQIGSFPSFSFMKLSGEPFNSSDIKTGPVLVVRFHPECEHCRYEISGILGNKMLPAHSKVLLISGVHPDSIRKFLGPFQIDNPDIMALADTSDSFAGIFGNDIVPSNYIYNRELKLVKVFFGEVKTETLCKYLKNDE